MTFKHANQSDGVGPPISLCTMHFCRC